MGAAPLHPGFGPGDRKAQRRGDFRVGQTVHLGEVHGLSIRLRQLRNHRLKPCSQELSRIIGRLRLGGGHFPVGIQRLLAPAPAQMIGHHVARNAVRPGTDPGTVIQAAETPMDPHKRLLQQIIGERTLPYSATDERTEICV